MLGTILWMLLASSAGVLSGILFDKMTPTPNPNPIIEPAIKTAGSFDFMKIIKLVGVLSAGAVALHFVLQLLKIKIKR